MAVELEELLDSDQVGKLLRMKRRGVCRLVDKQVLPAIRLPHAKGLLFSPTALRRVLAENRLNEDKE